MPTQVETWLEWATLVNADYSLVSRTVRHCPRAQELAKLYLKAPEVTRRNTRVHFIQPLKERIVREGGYGLSLEGVSAADLVNQSERRMNLALRQVMR
jgi:hypothetical protein